MPTSSLLTPSAQRPLHTSQNPKSHDHDSVSHQLSEPISVRSPQRLASGEVRHACECGAYLAGNLLACGRNGGGSLARDYVPGADAHAGSQLAYQDQINVLMICGSF
jgi:hypothetical protein